MSSERFKPAPGYLLCAVAKPRKLSKHNLVVPQQMAGQQRNRGGDAGNEVEVVAIHNDDYELCGPMVGATATNVGEGLRVKKGDRISITAIVAPVTVNNEQLLLVSAEDVLGVIHNWTPEDKVK